MAFDIGDVLKGENLLTTAAVGVGIYLLSPLLRPLAKTAIKGGIVAYDWAANTVNEVMEEAREVAGRRPASTRRAVVRVLSRPGLRPRNRRSRSRLAHKGADDHPRGAADQPIHQKLGQETNYHHRAGGNNTVSACRLM